MSRKVLACFLIMLFSKVLLGNSQDSVQEGFVAKMEQFFKESAKRSIQDLEMDRATIRQNRVLEDIKLLASQSRSFLRKDFDSMRVDRGLKELTVLHDMAKDGVFENKGSAQSSRNLTVTFNILNALSIEVRSLKREMDRYQDRLTNYQLQLDSLSNDPALFVVSKDSANVARYMGRIRVIAMEISPIALKLAERINVVHELENRINIELARLESDMEEVQYYQNQLSDRTIARNFVNIWVPSKFERPLDEILYFSFVKAKLLYFYYLRAHLGKLFFFFLASLVVVVYVHVLRRQINDKNAVQASLLLHRPLLSGLMIGFCVMQFIFPAAPFVFTITILTIASIFLSLVFRPAITKYWMAVWLAILTLFILAGLDNLVLQPSRMERWLILFIAVAACLVGLLALFNKKRRDEIKERWILFPIAFMVLLELVSVVLNLFGRFNLSKVLLVAGLTNAVVFILFLWVIRLVNEGLQLASSVYQKQERRLFYINYNRVGKRAPAFFYAVLIVGWFVLFGRNFYEFRFLADPLKDFLETEHRLGNYQFSVNNLVVFLLIMVCATVLSKIVSYFAADSQWEKKEGTAQNRFRLGSWILLVRITIIVIGFFLAFSALGIPVQQIGIIVGALGVGIGFGLQTLVNNLVSGLIIAFEKPVNVDDLIEIGGKSGKVKSIGFRSSVIATAEGADLIMPNGDLLNAHVMNWSQGGAKKRLSIRLEVKYGVDLERVTQLLKKILEEDEQILSSIGTSVQFVQVTSQAVVVELYFWVRTSKDSGVVKSGLLAQIYRCFTDEGIVLALPIQEVIFNQKDSGTKEESDH
ncbi:MAG: mechanosensitive ion channel [Sphingobacterium sp.]|jgi:small-conductance mechanosensitive channel|uniref:mechanosensitive ion channel family protein n=1 Tax=Sphingobacterium sp. TaxID=341027 RepID=UPI0028498067|nr:mechanosensitive ion channel domain-containing protein [Sphingobacterium sp.]MDR3008312.1 mechanosensitive ion channel [Sphingobacterium sp.]